MTMKTLRLIGMALMAVLVCINFAACVETTSADGDGGGDGGGGSKRLKEIHTVGETDNTTSFKYNEDGELIQIVEEEMESNGNKTVHTYKFHWAGNSIDIDREDYYMYYYNGEKKEHYGNYSCMLTLEGGLVQSCAEENDVVRYFNYNDNGRIASINGRYEARIDWNGDKMIRVSANEAETEISYGKTCSKGFFPLMGSQILGPYEELFNACPELIGARSNKLPTKAQIYDNYDGRTLTTNVSYKYKDGYVSHISTKSSSGYTQEIDITWE